jgi:hypothetical protein
MIASKEPGTKVELEVMRGKQGIGNVEITLGIRPE